MYMNTMKHIPRARLRPLLCCPPPTSSTPRSLALLLPSKPPLQPCPPVTRGRGGPSATSPRCHLPSVRCCPLDLLWPPAINPSIVPQILTSTTPPPPPPPALNRRPARRRGLAPPSTSTITSPLHHHLSPIQSGIGHGFSHPRKEARNRSHSRVSVSKFGWG
jgi:hypothetical protein